MKGDGRLVELKRVPGKTVKLTVTSDRITIKVPEHLVLEESKDLMVFLLLVAEDNPNPEFTLRGDGTAEQLRKYGIELRVQAKTGYHKAYPFPGENGFVAPE